jgi:hypothetical protein
MRAGSSFARAEPKIFDGVCAGRGNTLSMAVSVTIGASACDGRREE